MKTKSRLTPKEKTQAKNLGRTIIEKSIEEQMNPDLFLIEIIKNVYGHKIKLKDFIRLIESADLQ